MSRTFNKGKERVLILTLRHHEVGSALIDRESCEVDSRGLERVVSDARRRSGSSFIHN